MRSPWLLSYHKRSLTTFSVWYRLIGENNPWRPPWNGSMSGLNLFNIVFISVWWPENRKVSGYFFFSLWGGGTAFGAIGYFH
jgi:hypothetical protein